MTYKFVTLTEINKAQHTLVPVVAMIALRAIIDNLLSERDAYREVAIQIHKEYECSGIESACGKIIDAEAARILEKK